MKRNILLLLTILTALCFSCNTRVLVDARQLYYPTVQAHEPFSVTTHKEPAFENPIFLGTIAVRDNGFSKNCSYNEVLEDAEQEARRLGANVLKLTEHRVPDMVSTCHRIWAEMYKVDNPRDFEQEIEWSPLRKLEVADFKGDTANRPFSAATVSGFHYETIANTLGVWNGIRIKVFFDCNDSYFKHEEDPRATLAHEQLHFDITEVYARRFVKEIVDRKLTFADFMSQHERIRDEIFSQLRIKQDEYDSEVYKDRSKQEKWDAWVESQLRSLEVYSGRVHRMPLK